MSNVSTPASSLAGVRNRTVVVVVVAVGHELEQQGWAERFAQRPETDLEVTGASLLGDVRHERTRNRVVTQYVVDTSAAVEYLLSTPLGQADRRTHRASVPEAVV